MELDDRRVLVTGGAGLVGSALVDLLVADNDVVVVDDLSKGEADRVHDDAELVRADVADHDALAGALTADVDVVFHLAAITDTNYGRPRELFERNAEMTYTVLERMAEVGVDRLAFTSSSTVYGEAPRPTPEDHTPLAPISVYGAAKLADEGLISTFVHSDEFRAWTFRFANICGPHQRGTVIPDFVEKLLENPDTLEILGDGRQEKSYMHVTDCVRAICHVVENAEGDRTTVNLGTHTTTSVDDIAETVADVMGLDPEFEYTGGERGWTGDVPKMRLSIERLTDMGFEPDLESDRAVRRATEELVPEIRAEHDHE
jgi:UDP-glucose 4-epimerase